MRRAQFRTCGKCEHYSRGLLRCIHGQANPTTLAGTMDSVLIFGPSYICNYSKWRTKAVQRLIAAKEAKND